MTDNAGHWTDFGTAASVDWCEPNYVHSTFIAEWWNTVSCLPMVALGLYGLWRLYNDAHAETRFGFCFAALAMVGLGSIGFHGTILMVAQALDELPMIFGGLAFAYCLANRSDTDPQREKRWQIGLISYASLFSAAYFYLSDYFTFFIVSYAVIVTAVVLVGMRIAWGPTGSKTHKNLLGAAAGFFVGAVFLFWMPEHVWLACDHPLQKLQLHALWHVFAGFGAYLGFQLLRWDRLQQMNLNPRLHYSAMLFVPFVAPGSPDAPDHQIG